MDRLRQQLQRMMEVVAGLTVTQKMLLATLVAVMVLTMLYWGKFAATQDSVAVLEQSFPPEQAARVVAELERQGIRATVASDGRVMVPADRQMQAFSAVAFNRLLPNNSAQAVDKIIGQMTLWDTSFKTEKLWNEKKEVLLAQTISQFPGVDEAVVHIDPAERRSFTAPSAPRASINMRMKDGEKPGKHLVMAAADTVVGAQSGLTRSNVMVIVDGVSYPMQDRDLDLGLNAGEILGQKQEWERFYVGKLRDVLGHLHNPMIGVSVELKTQRIDEETYQVDPKNIAQGLKESSTNTTESNTPTPPAGDPGVVANVVPNATPSAAGSAGATNNTNTERSSFEVEIGKTRRTIKTPPGDAVVTSASVRVPRSHFIGIFRQLNPKATGDIDEATLGQVITTELEKVRKDVMACTGLKDANAVMVDYYVDAVPEPAKAGGGGMVIPVAGFVGNYGKEVAIGVLALAAMVMLSGIVKKGAGGVPAIIQQETIEKQRELERLAAGEEIIGAAAEGATALEAMEVDDETSATQQMVAQVTNMVKENPDGAVSLVKRWMNRT